MSISIKNIRLATASEWDHIWSECDYSTYFHSREWAEIWSNYTKGKMHLDPKFVMFTDGKKAIFPLSYRKTLKDLVKSYISSPAGTFGGWISTDELTVEHGKLLTNYLVDKHKNLVWRLNPYDRLVHRNGIKITKNDETHSLNLSDGFDAVYKKWTKGHASAARKARKEGVLISCASSLEDWQSYFRVYEDSLKRWAEKVSSRYAWGLFEEMFRRSSPNIKLWLSLYHDTVIAGALVFYAKKHAVYWHGAALAQYFNLRPVNLLMYEAIKYACKQGYSWFDFNPSGGHEGVKAFKKSFGAEALLCPVVNAETKTMFLWKKIIITQGRLFKSMKILTKGIHRYDRP